MCYDKEKWIYEHDSSKNVRYVLGTKGEKTLFCIGVNPSTATPYIFDNTVKRVEKIAMNNEYSNWIMLNIYPEISTDPNGLPYSPDQEIHNLNIKHIKKILNNYHDITIWVAWGNSIDNRSFLKNYLLDIYETIKNEKVVNYVAGVVNKTGNPRHPLFTKGDITLTQFDMEVFIKKNVYKQ